MLFQHTHPYLPFIPKGCTKLIVGTLPPPRFTTGDLKEKDVDFSYGSRDGQLWPILNELFELNLLFETSQEAINQRKDFLTKNRIGICDIVASATRAKVDASDVGMANVQLRDLVSILERETTVTTLLFTGGNSKNGPEYFFRKHLTEYGLTLELQNDEVPRIHTFQLKKSERKITAVSLTAPSGAANRAVGSLQKYKIFKRENPQLTTVDYRVLQYAPFFKD